MLTKVSEPLEITTKQIKNFYSLYQNVSNPIVKIQDNLEGYLIIKLKNNKIIMYNYYLNKFYSHNKIQIHSLNFNTIKQIDSFDQNNSLIANKLRTYIINLIKFNHNHNKPINSILGIGGEYYLYWKQLNWINNLIGITNHKTIYQDALLNIPWSSNYMVDYNKLESYPNISSSIDLVLVNVSELNLNTIKYIKKINFKKIIMILCGFITNNKFNKIVENFKIRKIKYFKNFDSIIRIFIMENIYL
jgi:hypothetical protein